MAISPTLRRWQLGKALRTARDAKGLRLEDVAKSMRSNVSTIMRVEAGTVSMKAVELAAYLDLYGITDDQERERLEQLRAEGRQRGWWSGHRASLRPTFSRFIGLEDAAVTRRDFSAIQIPGLLQTSEYARAVMAGAVPPLAPDVVEERLTVRLKRQEVITRVEHPLPLHVVLDEACVRRRVGGVEVWRAQLEHLLHLGEQHHITIQVLPFDAGALAEGLSAFVLLEFDDAPRTAYLELPTGDLYEEGPRAERFMNLFSKLTLLALAPAMSVALIRRLLDQGD